MTAETQINSQSENKFGKPDTTVPRQEEQEAPVECLVAQFCFVAQFLRCWLLAGKAPGNVKDLLKAIPSPMMCPCRLFLLISSVFIPIYGFISFHAQSSFVNGQ